MVELPRSQSGRGRSHRFRARCERFGEVHTCEPGTGRGSAPVSSRPAVEEEVGAADVSSKPASSVMSRSAACPSSLCQYPRRRSWWRESRRARSLSVSRESYLELLASLGSAIRACGACMRHHGAATTRTRPSPTRMSSRSVFRCTRIAAARSQSSLALCAAARCVVYALGNFSRSF